MVAIGNVVLEWARQAIVCEAFTQLDNSYKESRPGKLVRHLTQCFELMLVWLISIWGDSVQVLNHMYIMQLVLGFRHRNNLGTPSQVLVRPRLRNSSMQPVDRSVDLIAVFKACANTHSAVSLTCSMLPLRSHQSLVITSAERLCREKTKTDMSRGRGSFYTTCSSATSPYRMQPI